MLTPCMQCRRHIAEEQCPFCGGSARSPRELAPQSKRVSRAVVLAGALALPGCSGSEPAAPARSTTVAATGSEAAVAQPADGATQVAVTPPAPADAPAPLDASAPPADASAPPADAVAGAKVGVGKGSLVVIPRLGTSKKPLQRFMVSLMRPGSEYGKGAVTGTDGRAHFENLVPGEYIVRWYADAPRRRAPPSPQSTKKITVVADTQVEVEISVHTFQDHPIVTPYGAPSMRRRLV